MSAWTKGPWKWTINEATKHVNLFGRSYDIVMDFTRYGMRSAAPRFRLDGIMYRIDELATVEHGREHHAEWHKTINHPDANLIVAAPDLLVACMAADEVMSRFNVGLKDVLSAAIKKASIGEEK